MRRMLLVVSALLWGGLAASADVMQYRGTDGSVLLTNVPRISYDPSPPPAVLSAPRPAPSSTHPSILYLIHELARLHDVEPRLVHAMIRVESNFNPYAVSRAGAQGLMQLMPDTAQRYQVHDPFNPRANIDGGIRYLKDLFQQFPGDLRRALAAYNAGEGAVQRFGDIPPYPETRQYVERVLSLYHPSPSAGKIYRYRTANGSILFTNIPR